MPETPPEENIVRSTQQAAAASVRESIIAQAAHTSHSQVTPEEKIPAGAMHLSVGTKGAACLPGQRVTTNGPTMHARTAHHQNIYLFIHSSSKSIISPKARGGTLDGFGPHSISIARIYKGCAAATKNTSNPPNNSFIAPHNHECLVDTRSRVNACLLSIPFI